MTTHYDTLGIPKDADGDTIKNAYRRKRGHGAHPDKGGNHNAMVAINRAYDTLSDPDKRARYDRTGDDQPAQPPLDVKARGLIMQLFQAIVEQADDYQDLVELIRQNIRKSQSDAKMQASALRQKIKTLEKRKKRIKYTGNERNFLLDVLEERIGNMARTAAGMEEEAKTVGDRALEILRQFAYEAEQRPAPGDYVNQIFTVFMNSGTART